MGLYLAQATPHRRITCPCKPQPGERVNVNPILKGLMHGFRARKRLTLPEWAEKNIVVPAERSASPGPFRIGDATYQRGMMEAVTDPDNETVLFLTSSQVGKTSILTAAQGFYAEHEPSPQLGVFPTQIVADAYVGEQFEPTMRTSDSLRKIFKGLDYPGGYIAFVGANNPSQLAMRPIRVVTGDEVDRWPLSSGKEGSPADLAEKRTTTFRNRKLIFASTPVLAKTSQIVAMFKQAKQFFFHVRCPECEAVQVLKWSNVHFKKDDEANAHYACDSCGALWNEATKRRIVRTAEEDGAGWKTVDESFYTKGLDGKDDHYFKALRPEGKPAPGKVGFWINELYSPWSTMATMAKAWSDAEGNPTKEQTFRNTREGMPWDGSVSNSADADVLITRRETYSPRICPRAAGLITAAVDVQDDRLEVLMVAWGIEDECWLLEHIRIDRDPSVKSTWNYLDEVLRRRYPHEAGQHALGIEAVAIDSGGHFTQQAYAFSNDAQKRGRRWFAIKGVSGEGKPLWQLSDQKMKGGVKLYLVGVDDGKTTIYQRYGITQKGPGYIHLHEGVSEDFVRQMTAEHAVVEADGNGFPKRIWQKIKPHARNEGLDLMVYAMAARQDIKIDMQVRLSRLHNVPEKEIDAAEIGALFK